MASTYSTNLKIQLMATGENSTTWGATTNVNLGTALEEAVVGSASVTFSSGDVTLTLTDVNTSQPARNLRLNLTGTSGGARNLIVPALNKVFIVNNGCADAITVKNATGTGVAVAAGKTMWVYNNGTNVVDVVTHLTSLTLASALPTPSGGTGLTGFTAANNAIYSTSASALTAGTLPSGAGGTGLTTFTAANNAIYSTSSSALTAGTLPIAAGGTGAVTAAAALAALGIDTTTYLSSYVTLGNIKVQWGYTGLIATGSSAGVTFPSAFATACFGVVCTGASWTGTAGDAAISLADAATTSGFTAYAFRAAGSGSDSVNGFYIAIGY
jgi:hypothetical protein